MAMPAPAPGGNVPTDLPPPRLEPATSDDLVSALESLPANASRDRYDLNTRIATLGPGIEPAFEYVRDRIRYEPYSGILRGAEGAYAAGAGNALDRSLVLATMLQKKGITVRFARGRLARPEAQRLFARIFEPAVPAGEQPSSQDIATARRAAAFRERVHARARRDYSVLRDLLATVVPKEERTRDDALREIESHTWIEANVDGRWVALDSAFGDAAAGKSFAAAEQTFDVPPPELHQRVTIRVMTEVLEGGRLAQTTALSVTTNAVDIVDRQVFLAHAPGSIGQAITGALSGDATAAWFPVLWLDGAFHRGSMMTMTDGREAPSGFAAVFGENGGAAFVREWIEIEIASPDGRRDLSLRTLVDRRGAAWQSATPSASALTAIARDARGPLAMQALHNIWFSAGGHNLADYWDGIRLLAGRPAPADDQKGVEFAEMVWPLALRNFTWVAWTDTFGIPSLNDSPDMHFYVDSPRISIFSVNSYRPDEATEEIDWRRESVRGLSKDGVDPRRLFDHRVWFGALQGALEHEAAVEHAVLIAADPGSIVSTSGTLGADGAVRLLQTDRSRLGTLTANANLAARLETALTGDLTLIVPQRVLRGGPAAWWEISSAGNTRPVLEGNLAGSDGPSYARGKGPRPPSFPKQGGPPKAWNVDPQSAHSLGPRKAAKGGEEASLLEAIGWHAAPTWQKVGAVAETVGFLVAGFLAAIH